MIVLSLSFRIRPENRDEVMDTLAALRNAVLASSQGPKLYQFSLSLIHI